MKTKFGAIIVAGSGKLGGHVASKNRAGSYMRTKVTPVNPQSVAQGEIRGRFTTLSQGWKGLLQTERDAWNAAVSDYTRTDIFGDLRSPSGANLYQRLNNILVLCGESALDTPPLPQAVPAVVLSAITVTVGTPAFTVAFAPTVPVDTSVMVFCTAPLSAGKAFVKSEYRLTTILVAAKATGESILTAYQAKFGSVGEIGQKLFCKFVPVNLNTGQTGGTSSASVITAA